MFGTRKKLRALENELKEIRSFAIEIDIFNKTLEKQVDSNSNRLNDIEYRLHILEDNENKIKKEKIKGKLIKKLEINREDRKKLKGVIVKDSKDLDFIATAIRNWDSKVKIYRSNISEKYELIY